VTELPSVSAGELSTSQGPRLLCLLPLFTMADERPQTAKESKGFGKRLKQLIRLGSPSAPRSRSSSPLPSASTSGEDMSFAIVSSGVQLINPLRASSSTLQQGPFSKFPSNRQLAQLDIQGIAHHPSC